MKLRKRLLMSRSTAEGQTTSRHSRVVDGAVILVIAVGVAVNAVVLLDHRTGPIAPAPESNSIVADAPTTSTTVPASVAGAVEERPAWARELADQVSVLTAMIANQNAATTVPPKRTVRPKAPRTTTTTLPPAELGPATSVERPAPVVAPAPQLPLDTTTVGPTTTSGPEPTYLSAG